MSALATKFSAVGIAMVGALVLAFVLANRLGRHIARPLEEQVAASAAVADGDLLVQVPETASGELNQKRMIAATSDERRRSALSALRRVENEAKEIESRLAAQTFELTEAEGRIRELRDEINTITDRIASAGTEMPMEKALVVARWQSVQWHA